ncbi:OmpA family protein [Antarctobacter jejuensis]|uniref:OmpA family protein n=1 Tax=Antarctobacter jejuensis TaxID=1439938 RepID=UPI003FD36E0B
MKRLLLATAAVSVMAALSPGVASAQSFDLKQLCNPALGIKCGTTSRVIRKTPTVQTPTIRSAPVVRQVPKVQTAPKVFVQPKVQVVTPRIKTTPQVVVPKQITPQIVTRPVNKTPTVVVPDLKRVITQGQDGKIRVTIPKTVATPGLKTAPRPGKVATPGTIVVNPGGKVSIDDLRKQLAGQGGVIKVAPKPGATVKLPDRIVDLGASQRQADLLNLRDVGKLAAVAAGAGLIANGSVKVSDKTIDLQDIRLSSQDFSEVAKVLPGTIDYNRADLEKVLQKGDRVVTKTGDRMVVENNGVMRVLRNDNVLLNRPGAEVKSFEFKDGSTRNVMAYKDGSKVETILAPDGRVLRRATVKPDGTEVVLFDDTGDSNPVIVNDLPEMTGAAVVAYHSDGQGVNEALSETLVVDTGRNYSLSQVRDIDAVRQLVPELNIDTIHFASGSAAIRPEEAEELSALGLALLEAIALNPREVFLIEGHTDARGDNAYNLALSDRRAESVALALIEYFGVPPENMVLQGYGESALLIPTDAAEQANRRAAVRRITDLLGSSET